jgi:flap endonuclease-1
MGIRGLCSFLKDHCQNCSKRKNLYDFKNKKIVIDINNYLYRFLKNDCYIPSLYEMCALFNFYNITAIFVFDGIPPEEKTEKILKRREERNQAILKYNQIKELYEETNDKKLLPYLKNLNKKTLKLTNQHFREAKTLITLMGYKYIIANGEADTLCASMVIYEDAYACMSEDSDMFLLGCPRVLKYFSVIKHTVVEHDLQKILGSLHMSFDDFQKICILTGTDYTTHNNNQKFGTIYHDYINNQNNFYNYMETNAVDELKSIQKFLKISKQTNYEYTQKQDIDKNLKEFLYDFNFIFL